MDSNLPPVQKLVVPAASVSGNRSVSFRPTLTPGGVTRAVDRTARDTVSCTVVPPAMIFLYLTVASQNISNIKTVCNPFVFALFP